MAATFPSCLSYDPAYAYEVAILIEEGLRRMVQEQEDIHYYLTLYNENLEMPAMPEGSKEGILEGMYLLDPAPEGDGPEIRLLGSGSALPRVRTVARQLLEDHGIRAQVWSVTSYSELQREAIEVDRWNLNNPSTEQKLTRIEDRLPGSDIPVLAVTEYVRALPDLIRPWVSAPWASLGTDGYGRSDTREELRKHFETDEASIEIAALSLLSRQGKIKGDQVSAAQTRHGRDPGSPAPWRQ
jgi:pyruvate dehydrogenase E1 component